MLVALNRMIDIQPEKVKSKKNQLLSKVDQEDIEITMESDNK